MQLKNSFVLFTALTAGSAAARLHGHERRHAHHARHQDVDKRGVGDMVYATINGKLVSWINEWSGHQATNTAPSSPEATPTDNEAAATVATVDATPTPAPTGTDNSDASDWASYPANDQFSRKGFGGRSDGGTGKGIFYSGNVGDPWGSNIIEVPGDRASKYKHVVKINGHASDPWTVVFWNKIGPDGQLTGWYGNSALKFTIQPGDSKYVAFDDNSQGGWGAAEGDHIPTDNFGGYACTWGEFDFGSNANSGWSGWDVSAIQAQAAGLDVQGMKICDHKGGKCSSITNSLGSVINAYTFDLKGVNGIGGKTNEGVVRLETFIGYED